MSKQRILTITPCTEECPVCTLKNQCRQTSSDKLLCTRQKGHEGPHVACAPYKEYKIGAHNLQTWIDIKELPPDTPPEGSAEEEEEVVDNDDNDDYDNEDCWDHDVIEEDVCDETRCDHGLIRCGAFHEDAGGCTLYCTLPDGHLGHHCACRPRMDHNLLVWENNQ